MKTFNKIVIGTMLLVLAWSNYTMAETPTEVSIGAILVTGPGDPWDSTFIDTLANMKGQTIDGVTLTKTAFTEGVWGDPAQAAMRLYAKKYDIVWAHSSYSDQVQKIMKKFPDTMFVVVGSGNEYVGENLYGVMMRIHEPAYIAGVVAGMDTKSGVLGAVGGFASEDVSDFMNAFFAGAKSVNPNIKQKVAFIESWYDPPLAIEASKAQIAAGVDQLMMQSNAFEACKEHKITCYGTYRDWQEMVSDSSLGGSITVTWEPHVTWAIKEWKKAKESGQWDGNTEQVTFLMKDGASSLVFSDNASHSAEALAKAKELSAKITSGEFEVPLDVTVPKTTN